MAPITLYENLRTPSYIPFYLAIERGDWAREGIDVRVALSPSTAYTAQGLLDGAADVSVRYHPAPRILAALPLLS